MENIKLKPIVKEIVDTETRRSRLKQISKNADVCINELKELIKQEETDNENK